MKYPNLLSPLQLKGITIPNRIFSTGHDTDLGRHGLPTDALIAHQRARAMGGAGLIVVQVVAVHDTARYTAEVLVGTSDDCIPYFKRLFDAWLSRLPIAPPMNSRKSRGSWALNPIWPATLWRPEPPRRRCLMVY